VKHGKGYTFITGKSTTKPQTEPAGSAKSVSVKKPQSTTTVQVYRCVYYTSRHGLLLFNMH